MTLLRETEPNFFPDRETTLASLRMAARRQAAVACISGSRTMAASDVTHQLQTRKPITTSYARRTNAPDSNQHALQPALSRQAGAQSRKSDQVQPTQNEDDPSGCVADDAIRQVRLRVWVPGASGKSAWPA